MKKISIQGILFLTILLFGCENNNENQSVVSKSKPIEENINKDSFNLNDTVKIVYKKEVYDEKSKANIQIPTVNKEFLSTAKGGVKAVLGYYGAIAGTSCNWQNGVPNSEYSNINCKITSALNLGLQCSDKHKSFLKKWFSEEVGFLNKINNCYHSPSGATIQAVYNTLEIGPESNNIIFAKYKILELTRRGSNIYEGMDRFQISNNKIRAVSKINDNTTEKTIKQSKVVDEDLIHYFGVWSGPDNYPLVELVYENEKINVRELYGLDAKNGTKYLAEDKKGEIVAIGNEKDFYKWTLPTFKLIGENMDKMEFNSGIGLIELHKTNKKMPNVSYYPPKNND